MEILLWIVIILFVLFVIGKMIGELDIEKLDVAGLKREIWVTQNWIDSYYKRGCPPAYQDKFRHKQSRLEKAKAQLMTKSIEADGMKAVPADVAGSESFQLFVVARTMQQLTDLLASKGLVNEEEAKAYIGLLVKHVLKAPSADNKQTIEQVTTAVEAELGPVYQYAKQLEQQGTANTEAMALSLKEWYKNHVAVETASN
ncbi:MAG: hypothetical protein WC298_10975 [Sideroxydans sp.]|jgi:polyhydroxyalkanoate synthesis regulator phasin